MTRYSTPAAARRASVFSLVRARRKMDFSPASSYHLPQFSFRLSMSQPPADPPEALYPFERAPWNCPWLWWLLSAVVVGADFLTSPFILFPIFFVVPVLLVAWHRPVSRALATVAVLCIIRIGFHFHWGMPWGLAAALINGLIRCAVLSLLAVLTARVAAHTREMRRRVKLLEGRLPICGFCKDIRDDAGAWTKLEDYISHHSEVRFTTGVCPECADKHFAVQLEKRRASIRV